MTSSNPNLNAIEQEIARKREDLNTWLSEAYAGIEDRRFNGEWDASYPNWGDIEPLIGEIFDQGLVSKLSPISIASLLFFISRGEEIGSMIAWQTTTPGSALSWCGDLSYSDFLFLAELAVLQADDYCDYQLVSCFEKLDEIDDRAIDIVEQFFKKEDSYTRRRVLHVCGRFSLPQTIPFAEELWQSDECEFAKLSCLHALKGIPGATGLFKRYLREYQELFDVDAEEYRRAHLERLSSSQST